MNATEILKLHNVRKTTGRIAFVNALKNSEIPLSEAEIKTKMAEFYDRITFYRNVQTLTDAGVIHRIVADNTNIKYAINHCVESNHQHREHVHFACKKCGKILCLRGINTFDYSIPKGFTMDECDVIIKGNCAECNILNAKTPRF